MRDRARFADDFDRHTRAARPEDRSGDRPEGAPRLRTALWEIDDVSAYLRIPVSAIYKMTARGATVRIPHIRIGGRLRFRQDDIDQWLSLQSTSNLEALERIRRKASQVTHGNDP